MHATLLSTILSAMLLFPSFSSTSHSEQQNEAIFHLRSKEVPVSDNLLIWWDRE